MSSPKSSAIVSNKKFLFFQDKENFLAFVCILQVSFNRYNKGGRVMAEEQARANDNVIFVGRKPSMAYVLGVITQFSSGKNEVHIRARGKSISRAVDVAEIVHRR